jgi:hypothetical protein
MHMVNIYTAYIISAGICFDKPLSPSRGSIKGVQLRIHTVKQNQLTHNIFHIVNFAHFTEPDVCVRVMQFFFYVLASMRTFWLFGIGKIF